MGDMLHQLENNEAILLMYIAGELPDEERREVEEMLQRDSALRQMHDDLRAAWIGGMDAIGRLDASDPFASSREASARRVGRMVRSWHADRVQARSLRIEPAVKPRKRVPLWAASFSTAAALFVGFLVWWGLNEPDPTNPVAASTSQSNPMMPMGLMGPNSGGGGWNGRPYGFSGTRAWLNVDEVSAEGTFNVIPIDATGLSSAVSMADMENQLRELRDVNAGPIEPVYLEQ